MCTTTTLGTQKPWQLLTGGPCSEVGYLYNKRVRPTKNEPQPGILYLERAREGDERVWGG